jgi:hypothetical protein
MYALFSPAAGRLSATVSSCSLSFSALIRMSTSLYRNIKPKNSENNQSSDAKNNDITSLEANALNLTEDIPATEVKLLLSNKESMRQGFELSEKLIRLFDVSAYAKSRPVWYVDTPEQQLRKMGWSIRFRQQKDKLELTYKKRYTQGGYKSMLSTSLANAFAQEFMPEIDMGFTKKTVSLSCTQSLKADSDKPVTLEARWIAMQNCPAVLFDWNGRNKGFGMLCESVLYGPVPAINYEGSLSGLKIKIEVWKLNGYLSELSFDAETAQSVDRKKQVVRLLQSYDLLEPVNTLKTDALFDYYAARKPH